MGCVPNFTYLISMVCRNNLIIFVFSLSFFFFYLFLKEDANAAEWKDAGECFALIKHGRKEDVISDAKVILRNDRWNVDAYACLVMAYYYKDNYISIKKLREAEDLLPKDVVDRIHDMIWDHLPELLAEKEFRDNYTISGGDCILRNVAGLKGNGYLIIGNYLNPLNSALSRHLRGYRCDTNMQSCEDTDIVCPDCQLIDAEVVLVVKDYKLSDVLKFRADIEVSRNIRYITRILELQHGRP